VVVVFLAVVGAIALLLLILGPIAWLLGGDTVDHISSEKDKAAAINAIRGLLLQALAGVAAAIALSFTARTYYLSREGHVTDRYTKAIDQLGAVGEDQRVGGVFALERIMRDSPKDHAAVVDVLSAFIRVRAAKGKDRENGPSPDIRAALTVLARRPQAPNRLELDAIRLGEVNLSRSVLRRGRLDCVRLRGAILDEAHWEETSLRGAKLRGASLVKIDLERADLRFASMPESKLQGAKLQDTNLMGAKLNNADLAGATLSGSHLAGVKGDPKLTEEQQAQAHCLPAASACPIAGQADGQEPCASYDW